MRKKEGVVAFKALTSGELGTFGVKGGNKLKSHNALIKMAVHNSQLYFLFIYYFVMVLLLVLFLVFVVVVVVVVVILLVCGREREK